MLSLSFSLGGLLLFVGVLALGFSSWAGVEGGGVRDLTCRLLVSEFLLSDADGKVEEEEEAEEVEEVEEVGFEEVPFFSGGTESACVVIGVIEAFLVG